MVRVPPALVADVFHRAWTGVAVLYRTFLCSGVRELHVGGCDAADASRHLEFAGLSGFPWVVAGGCAAGALPELRAAVEFVMARFCGMVCAGPGRDGLGATLTGGACRRLGFGRQMQADAGG